MHGCTQLIHAYASFKVYIQTQRLDGLYVNPQRTSQTVSSPPTQESQPIMQVAVDYHGIDDDGIKETLSWEALQVVSGLMEQIRRVTVKHHLGVENDQLPTVGVAVDPFQFIPPEAHPLLARLGTMSRTTYNYKQTRPALQTKLALCPYPRRWPTADSMRRTCPRFSLV